MACRGTCLRSGLWLLSGSLHTVRGAGSMSGENTNNPPQLTKSECHAHPHRVSLLALCRYPFIIPAARS